MKNLKFIAISCLFVAQFAQASSYRPISPTLRTSSPTDYSFDASKPYRPWLPKIDFKQLCKEKGKTKEILPQETRLTFCDKITLNRDSVLAAGGLLLAGTSIYYGIKDKSLLRPIAGIAAGITAGYSAACAIEKVQAFDRNTKKILISQELNDSEQSKLSAEFREPRLNKALVGYVYQSWKDGFSAMFNVWNHTPSVSSHSDF